MSKMKSEVVYIDALFIDEKCVNITKCGEVLLFDGRFPDDEVVFIPYEESNLIVLKKGDIKACYHEGKTNLISFDLKPWRSGVGFKSVTFRLKSKSDSLSNELRSEIYLFLDFFLKNFHILELKPMKNVDDFCKPMMKEYLYAVDAFRSYGYERTLTGYHGKRFKWFLRAYVYFLNHYQLNEKEFKNFLRSLENLPTFCKNVIGFQQSNTFYSLGTEFLLAHICPTDNCCKATFKKCSVCKVTPYCSIECQSDSWSKHEPNCQNEETLRKLLESQRKNILEKLKLQSDDVIPVSFEVFQQELVTAVFSALWPLIEESMFSDIVMETFPGKHKGTCITQLKSLRKKQYSKMVKKLDKEKILAQIKATWG